MVGCCYFAPVASRVSARQPSYFFLRRQKKVTKKKASHVRAASRSLALLAAFGALANSLRSELSKCLHPESAAPLSPTGHGTNGGLAIAGSTVSLVGAALRLNFARMACSLRSHRGVLGLPHFSRLTSLKGTARRATTAFKDSGSIHKGCPFDLTPHKGAAVAGIRIIPHS